MKKTTQFRDLIPQIKQALELQINVALNEIGAKIAHDAAGLIGHPNEDWERLADSTEESKKRKDQPLDAPLEATGKLKESISYHVEGHRVVIGTDEPEAVYLEAGTEKMPPRSFMKKAALMNSEAVERLFAEAVEKALFRFR